MNLALSAVLLVAITAVTTALMLLVRRRAPDGGYFSDGDRAAGVFGVLATGFSLLVGFIIFLAFESYDASRSGAETEAVTVAQQVETAQFMSRDTADELTGELICYGRSVVGTEWPAMEDGSIANTVNPWGLEMFRTVRSVVPSSAPEQSAYDRWMTQTETRQQARQDRVHGAEGVLPWPLWIVLLVLSCLVVVFMLFFADSSERAASQGLMMASVTVVVTLLLFLLVFFDRPHGEGSGKLGPTAMLRSLALVDDELTQVHREVTPPCDERGAP